MFLGFEIPRFGNVDTKVITPFCSCFVFMLSTLAKRLTFFFNFYANLHPLSPKSQGCRQEFSTRGLTHFTTGLKTPLAWYYIICRKLQKDSFYFPVGVLMCSQGCYSPYSPPLVPPLLRNWSNFRQKVDIVRIMKLSKDRYSCKALAKRLNFSLDFYSTKNRAVWPPC